MEGRARDGARRKTRHTIATLDVSDLSPPHKRLWIKSRK